MRKFINSKYVSIFVMSLMLIFFVEVQAVTARADLGSVIYKQLNKEVSVQSGSAGYYHSQGADIYTLGYTRIRFGNQSSNFSLFAIQPPSFAIGCSGIDAMWGGFEMMIKNLLKVVKNIMAIAPEFAFDIALGVLCKQCESIMNQLESIANKLNGLNFNSCRTAQAASNIAVHALGNVLNLNAISGVTNSWASGVSSALSDIQKPIGSFISNVNNYINCNASTNGKKYVKWGGSCGEQAVVKKFGEGSLLLKDLKHAHLGIGAADDKPGTGGAGDIIGILRGSVLGDVVGFMPSSGKSGSGSNPIVHKFIAPEWNNAGGSSSSSNVFDTFLKGGELTSVNIEWNGKDADTPETLDAIEIKSQYCFYGFTNLFLSYLKNIYKSETGQSAVLPTTEPACSGSSKIPSTPRLSTQQQIEFISSSSLPIVEVMRMAYVSHSPTLLEKAANVMAISALYHWLIVISDEATLNVYDSQHADNKTAAVPSYIADYAKQTKTAVQYIENKYRSKLDKVNKLMATLAKENQDWITQLGTDGLLGAYNFSSHSS